MNIIMLASCIECMRWLNSFERCVTSTNPCGDGFVSSVIILSNVTIMMSCVS